MWLRVDYGCRKLQKPTSPLIASSRSIHRCSTEHRDLLGRATLGPFRLTPLGIVTAQSGLIPTRALLDYRQARYAQRLHARPKDCQGPEEILDRDGAAITLRLRAATSLRPGTTVEPQSWSSQRTFPGQVTIESRKGALNTAGGWSQRDTIWTDGTRLGDGRVGAACVWRKKDGWDGRYFHLGRNKEVFDAEGYAISQALLILDTRQECGRHYTVFVDSTSAIQRVQTNGIGPGQSFAVECTEICSRIMSRQNKVTIRWVPAQHGVPGNEKADEFARAAAEGDRPESEVADELRWQTNITHITRIATENKTQKTKQWISEHLGDPKRKYRVPLGKGVRRQILRHTPKHIAVRYYQLLSGHAAIGTYLKDKIRKIDSDNCWWCGGGKRQARHHLFTECRA